MMLVRFFAAAVSGLLKYSLGGLIAILALSWNLHASAADIAADESVAQACLDSNAFQEPEETLRRCEAALKLPSATQPETAKFHLQRGLVFHWAMRAELSIPEFDKALKLDSSLQDALLQRGWAYTQVRQDDRAYRDFTDVLARDPENAKALFGLAYIFYYTPRHDQAVQLLRQALEADPDYALARSRLAHHYSAYAGDLERALEEYDRVLAAAPGVLEATPFTNTRRPSRDFNLRNSVELSRARVQLDTGRFREAFAALDPLAKAFPLLAEVVALRGMASFGLRNYEAALADAEQAIRLDSYSLTGQLGKMDALFKLKRYDEAMEAANTTLAMSWNESLINKHALKIRALIYKSRGETANAKADFEKLVQLGGVYRTDVIMRLKDLGYYSGGPHDEYNTAMSNGLDACLIDPECYK